MSLLFFPMSIGSMSHDNFKKRLCRTVDFKRQGPHKSRPVQYTCTQIDGVISYSCHSCFPIFTGKFKINIF